MLLQIKAIQEESTRKGQGGLSFTAEVFEIITSVNKENHRAIHLYINRLYVLLVTINRYVYLSSVLT